MSAHAYALARFFGVEVSLTGDVLGSRSHGTVLVGLFSRGSFSRDGSRFTVLCGKIFVGGSRGILLAGRFLRQGPHGRALVESFSWDYSRLEFLVGRLSQDGSCGTHLAGRFSRDPSPGTFLRNRSPGTFSRD